MTSARESHPSWVRGLKQGIAAVQGMLIGVAPFVGAWIETVQLHTTLVGIEQVAPFVGAWIETRTYRLGICTFTVAPFVGAWIETQQKNNVFSVGTVAPFVGAWIETCSIWCSTLCRTVAPFVGAWIETNLEGSPVIEGVESHPSWVRGLKLWAFWLTVLEACRTLRGCVD